MPSKGIDCYSYVSPYLAESYEVQFSVPGDGFTNSTPDNFSKKHLEVESSRIPGKLNFVGQFKWLASRDGQEVASGFNNINTLTGNLAPGGTMLATQHFTPFITDDAIITYGFYDAGHGQAGLTDHDQCYVYISPLANQSWMGQVAPPGSDQENKPFCRFALVAPHDNGMNSMQSCDAVLQGADEGMVAELRRLLPRLHWFSHIPDSVLAHMLPNIVYGVSITQKKPISTMLALGARYFEFRPAALLPMFRRSSQLSDKLYFQHACIPGLAFDEFLHEQVTFLDAHPTEMIVIHIRHDNIVKDCRIPDWNEVASEIAAACSQSTSADSATPLTFTAETSMFTAPISTLRATNTRILVLFNAQKYDSWTATAYATLTADPIIAQFNSMTTEGQTAPDSGIITVLQCQATSQSIKEVLLYSVLASNTATSCLTSTKADLDRQTLPWIRSNANERLQSRERLLVVMNDFIDGATCETGIELSRGRLAWD